MLANKPIYQFEHLKFDAISKGAGANLLTEHSDGIVITDFLSKDEVARILEGFHNLSNDEKICVMEDFISYPESFAQFTQKVANHTYTDEDYYRLAQDYVNTFQARFGVPLVKKLTGLLELLFSGITISVPQDKARTGCFVPFNFRELKPGKGELMVHCENLFFEEFPQFFEKLNHIIIRENEFSFFMVLQKPESGGELCLYNLKWPEYNNRIGHKHIVRHDGSLLHEDDDTLQKQLINVPEGALVIFKGGNIWHRINVVEGSKSRITLGGFMSSSPNGQQLYFWA